MQKNCKQLKQNPDYLNSLIFEQVKDNEQVK